MSKLNDIIYILNLFVYKYFNFYLFYRINLMNTHIHMHIHVYKGMICHCLSQFLQNYEPIQQTNQLNED